MDKTREKNKSKMTVGNNIKRLLELKGESIAQMGKALGVTYVTAHSLYHSKTESIGFELMNKLCKYFGVGPSELFPYLPENTSEKESEK
jgi:transcriptional regulator with XRE-family HTH domain